MSFSYVKSLFSVFVILSFSTSTPTMGQTYLSKENGNWTSGNTWMITQSCSQNPSGSVPPLSKDWGCPVDIKIAHAVTYRGDLSNFGNGLVKGMEISPGGSLTITGNFTLPANAWGDSTYLRIAEGALIKVSGTFAAGKSQKIVIEKNASVTVGNLIVDDNNPEIIVEEGAELIVLNQTTIKAKSSLNIKGRFVTKTLTNNSGNLISSGSGTTHIEGNIYLNESARLKFSGNSSIISEGRLEATGAGSMDFAGNSEISLAGDMILSAGAKYVSNDRGKIHVGGHLSLDGGAYLDITGGSEGHITGNVDLKNGEIITSDNSHLYVDGKLRANWGHQVKTKNLSRIEICDYGNSNPLDFFVNIQPNSYYGPGCYKLPVDWMEIKVVNTEIGKNRLTWATAKEWENSHFEIERSTNGIDDFEKIGEISGMGWSSSVTSYSYDDRGLHELSGNIYYRIKQVDFTGNTDYSEVVGVKLSNNPQPTGQWKAFPNPYTGSDLRISMTDSSLSSAEYVDMRMISSSFQSDPIRARYGGDLDIEISNAVKKAPRGIVIIELVWNGNVSHVKIMKN